MVGKLERLMTSDERNNFRDHLIREREKRDASVMSQSDTESAVRNPRFTKYLKKQFFSSKHARWLRKILTQQNLMDPEFGKEVLEEMENERQNDQQSIEDVFDDEFRDHASLKHGSASRLQNTLEKDKLP